MSSTIGELSENLGEIEIEWRIADFISLPKKIDDSYCSPVFYFSGASWYLKIYPNGESKRSSKDYVGLYIAKGNSGPSVSATYVLEVKTAEGEKTEKVRDSGVFAKKDGGWGASKFLSRSALEERQSDLAPSDVLTITCCLKHKEPNMVAISLFRRLQNVCNTFKKALTGKKRTDVELKVEGRKFRAHRMVLESQSPAFVEALGPEMEKNRTGVVNIRDIPADAFERVLCYMYSGDIDGMSFENVFHIYAAADKYDFRDLKQLCMVYIQENLCVERVCDVIELADIYREEEMELSARKYFKENMKEVLETDHWKTFVKENSALSVDLLSTVVKEFL